MTDLNSKLPSTLCRFRAYGGEANGTEKQTVHDLLKGRVLFREGSTFNDPFEGKPHHVAAFKDSGKQRYAMEKYLASIARERGMSSVRKKVGEHLAKRSMPELIEYLGEVLRLKGNKGTTLLCLSHPDVIAQPLPWSHYANAHRGVCIEFDTALPPIRFAIPINYSSEYPTLAIPRTAQSQDRGMILTFLTKSEHWRYENEYRVIRSVDEPAGIATHLDTVWDGDVAVMGSKVAKRVTLGATMQPRERSQLLNWVRDNAPHVEVWQADLHRTRYEIVRERVI